MAAPKQKRPKLSAAEKDEAAGLEALIFGRDAAAVDALGEETNVDLGLGFLGVFEAGRRAAEDDADAAAPAGPAPREGRAHQQRRSVWEDPADEALHVDVASQPRLRKLRHTEDEAVLPASEYQQRLRAQHTKLNPRTSWAAAREPEAEGSGAAAVAARAGGLLAPSRLLPPSQLETTRLKDANQQDPSQSVVSSVQFHPNGQLLLAAGLDKRLRFFSVDGATNPRVQSVFLEDMPVRSAAFAAGGAKVLAAGRRKFFYVLDLETAKVERVAGVFAREERSLETLVTSASSSVVAFLGRDGHVPLVSLTSRQAVGGVKMNGTARAGAFSADGRRLLTSGGDGQVYVWDLRMQQRCLSRFVDEGSVGGTSLACSPDSAVIASGSSSGVVNVYSGADVAGGSAGRGEGVPEARRAPAPLRALTHLTTSVDSLAFNHDGQVMAMASRLKRDALRLVHLPTLTAYANWPTSRTPLHYVHSLAFSPGGGYLAVGNAKGRVLLYRLHHYPQA